MSHKKTIGYFVPEYPGQTHIFFWREMLKLRALGIQPEVVSTRRPAKRIISHSWAEDEMKTTVYLYPPGLADALKSAVFVLRCGPAAWWRCINCIRQADDVTVAQRLRLALMVLLGGRLALIARQQSWDHIHVHSCADAANIAMFASLLTGIPYSMTLHGPIHDYGPNQKQKWHNSSFTIVITNRLHREAREQLGDFLPQHVPIAPMGVALENFQRSGEYQPWDGASPLRIFSCGRLNVCKGHEHMIRAIGELRDRDIDVQLEIAGACDSDNSPYRQLLEETIAELDLQDRVHLLGAISESKVRDGIESAHIFALASLHEPLGVVYMEAMAMECPTVATNGGGVRELIESGNNGLLVDPENPMQLADAIEQLALDPALSCHIGQQGRQTVEQSFHSGVSAQTIATHLGIDIADETTHRQDKATATTMKPETVA